MRATKSWTAWTGADHHKLAAMVARGDTWESIAKAFGRSVHACELQHRICVPADRRREISAMRLKLARERPKAPKPPPRAFQAPASPPSRRRVSTAALVMDAEIRARIATQGPTAGLLGDPVPGRSAFDKQRAGIADPPAPLDHRAAYYASRPKITLATEPMR